MAEVKSISLDEEAQELWERNEDLIEDSYGGRSGVFKDKLKEIDQKDDLEARMEKKRKQIAKNLRENLKLSRDLSELQERKAKQEKREKLPRKRKELQNLQEELAELKETSEKDLRDDAYRYYVEDSGTDYDLENDPEARKNAETRAKRKIENHQEKIKAKEEEIQALESEIKELEGDLND